MNEIFTNIQMQLKEELDEKRYEHTIGVMYTAASLAMRYGVMMHQAILAGLLHDCAKAIPNDEKLELCKKYGIIVSDVERENPSLLHAKLGAYIAREKYGVMDDEVLHAIYVHTTGEPGMSTLDKILFVADYIEPNRDSQPNLEYVRKIAFWDLNQALEGILYDTLEYLKKSDKQIDSMTQKTYEYYASTKESQNRRNSMNQSAEMVKIAAKALEDKKAEDIRVIDIREISTIADFFVIANGTNANQLAAMRDAVDEELYKAGYHTKQVEGNQNSTWILMDYNDIIVHIFSKEDRLFYDLERMWTDGKQIDVNQL